MIFVSIRKISNFKDFKSIFLNIEISKLIVFFDIEIYNINIPRESVLVSEKSSRCEKKNSSHILVWAKCRTRSP